MTNKKLAGIIASKIMIGELTSCEFENLLSEKMLEEVEQNCSKYVIKAYKNLRDRFGNSLSFEDTIKLAEIFELASKTAQAKEGVVDFESRLNSKYGEGFSEKVLSEDFDELFTGLKFAISNDYKDELGLFAKDYWNTNYPVRFEKIRAISILGQKMINM